MGEAWQVYYISSFRRLTWPELWRGMGVGSIFSEIGKVFAEKRYVLKAKFGEGQGNGSVLFLGIFWFYSYPTPCPHPRNKLGINTKY